MVRSLKVDWSEEPIGFLGLRATKVMGTFGGMKAGKIRLVTDWMSWDVLKHVGP